MWVVDGPRMQKLRLAMRKAVELSADSLTVEVLEEAFAGTDDELLALLPDLLEQIRNNLVTHCLVRLAS